jgi:hypothetical protein
MVGRNFWVVEEDGAWEVRQEGLPDQTSRHADRDEAWETANARAKEAHGEAFLADGQGGYSDYACYRELPRKAKE